MVERKKPERKCTGCGEMKRKQELVRVVRDKDGVVTLDPTGKKPGRGAYICNSKVCLESARKGRRLEKAFSARIPDEVYESLSASIGQGGIPDERGG